MLFEDATVNIVTSFIILILGLIVARILVNIVRNLFKDVGLGEAIGNTLLRYVVSIVQYFVYIVTLFFIFRQFGLGLFALQWIGLFLLGFVLVLVFLSFKDTLPNLTAWLYVRKKYSKGQDLVYSSCSGKIVRVGFFEVAVRNSKKELLFIPNARLVLR